MSEIDQILDPLVDRFPVDEIFLMDRIDRQLLPGLPQPRQRRRLEQPVQCLVAVLFRPEIGPPVAGHIDRVDDPGPVLSNSLSPIFVEVFKGS